jgi:hypothetical protein
MRYQKPTNLSQITSIPSNYLKHVGYWKIFTITKNSCFKKSEPLDVMANVQQASKVSLKRGLESVLTCRNTDWTSLFKISVWIPPCSDIHYVLPLRSYLLIFCFIFDIQNTYWFYWPSLSLCDLVGLTKSVRSYHRHSHWCCCCCWYCANHAKCSNLWHISTCFFDICICIDSAELYLLPHITIISSLSIPLLILMPLRWFNIV